MSTQVRVLVADDHAFMRATVAAMVNADPSLRVAATAATAEEAVALARITAPDVVLVDVGIAAGGGRQAAAELRRLRRPPQVVALAAVGDDTAAVEMLASGACCFVVKERAASIVDAIRWASQASAERRYAADVISLDRFRAVRG